MNAQQQAIGGWRPTAGERVVVRIERNSRWNGQEGQVLRVDPDDGTAEVLMDSHEHRWWCWRDLRQAELGDLLRGKATRSAGRCRSSRGRNGWISPALRRLP